MKLRDNKVTENDLLAYVDGALDDDRRIVVEAHLAANPADAETIAAWSRQDEAIKELYHRTAGEPLPVRLDARRIADSRRHVSGHWLRLAATVVLCLAFGGAGGWYGHNLLAPATAVSNLLVDEAIAAHSLYTGEVMHPVEVRAGAEGHLSAWLSKRLDRPLAIPKLGSAGFHLVGGRLLPAGEKPAAQFMYEDESGRRVTLYIVPATDGRETSFQYTRRVRLEAFFWRDEAIDCVLVGALPREQLHDLALQAYRQLG